MLPSETQRIIDEHGIKYVLAQFVDIHGAAKTKSVPVEHYETVVTDGAGSVTEDESVSLTVSGTVGNGQALRGLAIEP